MSPQSWLNRVWYADAQPPWWLKPPAALYGAVLRFRRALYQSGFRRRVRLNRPVVVVGNLSVGGTGKTPLVCWLTERLQARGFKPGVVLRGYGGALKEPRLLQERDEAALVGDEAVLLRRRTGRPVAVGRDRPAAAALLLSAGCDVIIADDGLQHYALERDCEIAVIDAARRFGNGYLLPAGPLREPKPRLTQVDAVVVNGGGAEFSPVPAFTMHLQGDEAAALSTGAHKALREFAGVKVHAVAGIGNPQRFFDLLSGYGIEVTPHPFADHAALRSSDIDFPDDWPVLMTEKDAVKCAHIAGPQHWYVPVSAHFEPAAEGALLDIVQHAVDSFDAAQRS
jgi:tetraacyldisaccharide 4'-kinase